MHDLHLERFLKDEPGDGPIKTFTLRGIKDSPPYMHDGRCLTLEDTVEFFNLVLRAEADCTGEAGSGRVHATAIAICTVIAPFWKKPGSHCGARLLH